LGERGAAGGGVGFLGGVGVVGFGGGSSLRSDDAMPRALSRLLGTVYCFFSTAGGVIDPEPCDNNATSPIAPNAKTTAPTAINCFGNELSNEKSPCRTLRPGKGNYRTNSPRVRRYRT